MIEAPRESWDSLARAAASVKDASEQEIATELLCFVVDGDPYAVPVERVREIVRFKALTEIPRVPSEVLGVISLRGEIVQVVDLRLRLGSDASELSRMHRIVVLHGEEGEVSGLVVDEVKAVFRADEGDFQPPATGDSVYVSSLCERGDEFVGILNLERVLELG